MVAKISKICLYLNIVLFTCLLVIAVSFFQNQDSEGKTIISIISMALIATITSCFLFLLYIKINNMYMFCSACTLSISMLLFSIWIMIDDYHATKFLDPFVVIFLILNISILISGLAIFQNSTKKIHL